MKIIFDLAFLILIITNGYKACRINGYVPSPPSIKQNDVDVVFVDWLGAMTQKVDITEMKLRYWESEALADKNDYSRVTVIPVEDLDITFTYVSVKHWTVYSYQLMVKTSGM